MKTLNTNTNTTEIKTLLEEKRNNKEGFRFVLNCTNKSVAKRILEIVRASLTKEERTTLFSNQIAVVNDSLR